MRMVVVKKTKQQIIELKWKFVFPVIQLSVRRPHFYSSF